ncbi:MAG: ATP-dependent DNA helicase RecG [Chloroflexi bacterium]|nr:ATP-dependent DNA helicase RecG [Chloroflexota bacterium]
MDASFQRLRDILKLESQRGYANGAVIGGLDEYLRRWASQHLGQMDPQTQRDVAHLGFISPDYARQNVLQRREWVGKALGWLMVMENGSPLPPPPKAVVPARKEAVSLTTPLSDIRGVPPPTTAHLTKMGVKTVRDLLYFFPHRHQDFSQIKTISQLASGEEQTVVGTVLQAAAKSFGSWKRGATEAVIGDSTGKLRVVWFNQPYLAQRLPLSRHIVLSGRVNLFRGQKVMESPEWEPVEEGEELIHTGRLVPVYPLTQGLHARTLRRVMKGSLSRWLPFLEDFLPPSLREKAGLMALPQAVRQMHFPDSEEMKGKARRRLAFDELFLLQLGVLAQKREWQEVAGHPFAIPLSVLQGFLAALPFSLTAAQARALDEITGDLRGSQPMSRLLQGEVGSGKTVVAVAALILAVADGHQGVLMAPTEILAEQHYRKIRDLLGRREAEEEDEACLSLPYLSRPVRLCLLTGGTPRLRKEEIYQGIAEGKIDIVVGTHSLIQEGLSFARLGLAIVDEQHRFGVLQRSALRQKGYNPHMLVMTATPIPRTLALTLYGDLNLTVIDELPPGRQPIVTRWLRAGQRPAAYDFVRQQVREGRQAFVLCPLIEESEKVAAKAAVAEYERLSQGVFPDLRLGLLHGRMSAAEKDEVMQRFREGELDIMVSTPVVEVGIDIPNATVMLVEGAERFGLSQLHQFRGRVGRGKHRSYCLLLSQRPTREAMERLRLLEESGDGFRLAEEDLRLRGPGEFFGTRQSGLPELRLARLSDVPILETARREAAHLFQTDPHLANPQHQLLAQEVARFWHNRRGEIS